LPLGLPELALLERVSTAAPTTPLPQLTRILVAEDNAVNRRLLELLLRPYTRELEMVENGRDAVERVSQGTYDLVLMDGQMPELGGMDATRAIRQLEETTGRPRTPIVALTANALPGDREEFLASGMDDYLSKPLRTAELERVVRGLCTRRT